MFLFVDYNKGKNKGRKEESINRKRFNHEFERIF